MYDSTIKKGNSLIIKAIAVLLMVLHHCFAFPERISGATYKSLLLINNLPIEYYMGQFGGICVPLFLFVAGYAAYINYTKDSRIKALINRLSYFYLNYWLVFIIFIPIGIALRFLSPNLKDVILNFIGLISTYNAEWWFLRLYVVLTLSYPLIYKGISKYSLIIVSSVSLTFYIIGSMFTVLVYRYKLLSFEMIGIILSGQFVFVIGTLTCKYSIFDKLKEYVSKFKMNIIIYLLVLLSSIGFYYIFPFTSIYNTLITPIFIFSIANVIPKSRLLSYIGKHSTNIWLTHSFFCYYYFNNWIFSFKYSISIYSAILVITVIVSIVINKFLFWIRNTIKNNGKYTGGSFLCRHQISV